MYLFHRCTLRPTRPPPPSRSPPSDSTLTIWIHLIWLLTFLPKSRALGIVRCMKESSVRQKIVLKIRVECAGLTFKIILAIDLQKFTTFFSQQTQTKLWSHDKLSSICPRDQSTDNKESNSLLHTVLRGVLTRRKIRAVSYRNINVASDWGKWWSGMVVQHPPCQDPPLKPWLFFIFLISISRVLSALEPERWTPYSLVGSLYSLLPYSWLGKAILRNFLRSSLYWLAS